MKIKTFTFVPDNHYAYPEVVHDSVHISSIYELIDLYINADCTALTMGDWEAGEEDAFMRFSYNSYYENLYIITYTENVSDEEIRNLIENVHNENMEEIMYTYEDLPSATWSYEDEKNPWINGFISSNFLKKLAEDDDIISAVSFGKINEIASNKKFGESGKDQALTAVLDELVVKEFRSGNKMKAGKDYAHLNSSIEGIDILLSKILSPEEMKNMISLGKGHDILGRFK